MPGCGPSPSVESSLRLRVSAERPFRGRTCNLTRDNLNLKVLLDATIMIKFSHQHDEVALRLVSFQKTDSEQACCSAFVRVTVPPGPVFSAQRLLPTA